MSQICVDANNIQLICVYINYPMSLFIVGSVSRITSNIVHHLAKNSLYKSVTIADLLPAYDFHHRFYRLQKELDQSQLHLNLNLTKLNNLNDLSQHSNYDDVLYVTHDYYQSVTSKTKLMELTAEACRYRKYLYFATPAEYDHFGYANPESHYTDAEKKVLKINPNSTVIRSEIQESTEAFKGLARFPNFKPKTASSAEFAQTVCDVMAAKVQGKRILVRGKDDVERKVNHGVEGIEY